MNSEIAKCGKEVENLIDKERLRRKAAACGINLMPEQLDQLEIYAALLLEWNQKVNLTAITQPEEVEDKHFLDSLLFAALPQVQGRLADVGSGAGFPGVVAQIYKPSLALVALEPTGKRVAFLQEVLRRLGLAGEVAKERAEEAARKGWREGFDVCTARAVAALPVLCEYCLPLVKPGGWFIAMKGDAAQEIADAQAAIAALGGTLRETRQYTLPDGAARSLVLIEKTAATPEKYPRPGGTIKKRPL
ncbi:16S rRNA (guanine(527)-N(7))-methyltransferase RsmG [Ruminococcaceae bacterium OttesenSCG-928-O06]|nr:16S rRNA (guanine(527)-N(7))-methyltransferase RsmG [Ruminococcaceae bacterium OttesenSCG-928-O06]